MATDAMRRTRRRLRVLLIAALPLATVLVFLAGGSAEAAVGWAIVPSPTSTSTTADYPSSVSCVSINFCVSVGLRGDTNPGNRTLIDGWDGSSWIVMASADVSQNDLLTSVSCASTSFCIATGSFFNGSLSQTLIEEWDGSNWNVVPSPSTQTNDALAGVSCVSASFCMASGSYQVVNSPFPQTLIEEWDGDTWSIVNSPDTSTTQQNELRAVSCASTSFCMATGDFYYGSAVSQPIIEGWDGTSWSLLNTPTTNYSILWGVSCVSTSFCMAAGQHINNAFETLIEEWDGTSWSIVSSPNTSSTQDNVLNAVSCTSASFCMADGEYSGTEQTLTEEWNGSSWAIVSSPNTGHRQDNFLRGVTCTSASFCMAAGYSPGTSHFQALIEEWADTSTYQDSDAVITFNAWQGMSDPTANGGTYRVDSRKAAKATFKFTGTGIAWVTRKGPDQGIASVTIDGVSQGTLDLYAASAQGFSQSYLSLTSASHTVVVTVKGTKNSSSTGTNVVVDAFVVGSTTTQDSSAGITYDTWMGASSSKASGGTDRTSSKSGAMASLNFTGTRVTWVTATGPANGEAQVSIDGVTVATVDLYASSVTWQVSESYGGLSAGSHTIVVTVLGAKNASSSSTKVAVDAFIIQA